MPNHVCSSAVCINYRYFLLIFQQQEENKLVSQVYTRRLRLKVRSKVRPYVEMASAIFTLFDIQPSFLRTCNLPFFADFEILRQKILLLDILILPRLAFSFGY